MYCIVEIKEKMSKKPKLSEVLASKEPPKKRTSKKEGQPDDDPDTFLLSVWREALDKKEEIIESTYHEIMEAATNGVDYSILVLELLVEILSNSKNLPSVLRGKGTDVLEKSLLMEVLKETLISLDLYYSISISTANQLFEPEDAKNFDTTVTSHVRKKGNSTKRKLARIGIDIESLLNEEN